MTDNDAHDETDQADLEEQRRLKGLEIEFGALRTEVMTRVQLRTQVLLATLTLAGLILGFGLNNPAVAFLFPVLAMFLAAAWVQNDARIKEITAYIREQIEPEFMGLGWERYRATRARKGTRVGGVRLSVMSAGGVFLITQAIAILIGFTKFAAFSPLEWVLGLMAVAATLFSLYLWRTSH